MRLLVITQKVDQNDANLGFFHAWLLKMAQRCDLFVVANEVGKYNLPLNVKVVSLKKERGINRPFKFIYYQWLMARILPKVDGIFFHMCPEYVLAAGFWPMLFHKKTLLWYAHKNVTGRLRLAERLVDRIFTPSKDSCRMNSRKIEVVGHGIDLVKFQPEHLTPDDGVLRVISVGRLAAVKNYEIMIEAVKKTNERGVRCVLAVAGAPILNQDKIYFDKLRDLVVNSRLDEVVKFVGPISYDSLPDFYHRADLFINLSNTGSVDKAILEAMACGLSVLTSNDAFKDILPSSCLVAADADSLANKIIKIKADPPVGGELRQLVAENHNLDNLIPKIINFF